MTSSSRDEMLSNMLASATCVSVAVVVFNPLDCLRIRWQVEPPKMGQTIFSFARRVVASEGLVGGLWWPGLGANAIGAFVCRGVGFGCYPTVRDMMSGQGNEPKSKISMFGAGLVSGGIGYGISTPMWQMKTRLQATTGRVGADGLLITGLRKGKKPLYRNGIDGIMQVTAQEGALQLYRGLWPLVIRGALMNSGNTLGNF